MVEIVRALCFVIINYGFNILTVNIHPTLPLNKLIITKKTISVFLDFEVYYIYYHRKKFQSNFISASSDICHFVAVVEN